MKFKVYSLIICTCMIFVLSTDNEVTRRVLELDQVESVYENKANLNKFLAAASDDFTVTSTGFPITISDCMEGSVLQLTNILVEPKELTKGKPISMRAEGVFTEEKDVVNLHVDAFYNGSVIFKNDVDKPSHQTVGEYSFAYDNNVPTFTPSGHWETFVYVIGKGGEKLACIKATFDTS